jgi:hypothetical protein
MTLISLIAETEAIIDAIFSDEFTFVVARFDAYLNDADFCDDEESAANVLAISRHLLAGSDADVMAERVAALLMDTFQS